MSNTTTKRAKPLHLDTEDEVEKTLIRLAEIEEERARVTGSADETIRNIREGVRPSIKVLDNEKKRLESAIKRYGKSRVGQWQKETGQRSKQFTHGTVRVREVSRISVPRDETDLIARAEELEIDGLVVTYKRIDREELRKQSDVTLEALGLKRTTTDDCSFELAKIKSDKKGGAA